MKESHSEGVANHTGSESCGEPREGLAEALTGEIRAGLLSREITLNFGTPTFWIYAGPHSTANRKVLWGPARSKTLARMDALCTGTGRSRVRPVSSDRAASGSL